MSSNGIYVTSPYGTYRVLDDADRNIMADLTHEADCTESIVDAFGTHTCTLLTEHDGPCVCSCCEQPFPFSPCGAYRSEGGFGHSCGLADGHDDSEPHVCGCGFDFYLTDDQED